MNKKGKLIVLDGTDGSGKATQARELKNKLASLSYQVESLDFPQYYNNFFGKMIGECLKGDYGNWKDIHPKIASVIYACDRAESKEQINTWLSDGAIVVLDRYVSSNQIHQGGKIEDDQEREDFIKWLHQLEHNVLSLPEPDLIIYLDVPFDTSAKLLVTKGNMESKEYLGGKKDQHEGDRDHLEKARASGLKSIQEQGNWKLINCIENNEMRSIEDIHNEIFKYVTDLIKKP